MIMLWAVPAAIDQDASVRQGPWPAAGNDLHDRTGRRLADTHPIGGPAAGRASRADPRRW